MPKISEIVVAKDTFEEDPLEAVSDYVHGLAQRFVRDEEMPPKAVQCHALGIYVGEVLNGNIGQFVTNTRWHPLTVAAVRDGLRAIGATGHVELFEDVAKEVEASKPELEAALRSSGQEAVAAYWSRLAKIRGDFYYHFSELPDLEEAIAAWVATWKDVKRVSDTRFERDLDRLAAAIPEREQRRAQAAADRPWEWKRAEEVVRAAGYTFVSANTVDRYSDSGVEFQGWHVSTGAGHHRVVFVGGEAVLYRGFTAEIVARVPAPEGPAARPSDGWEKRVGFKNEGPFPQRNLSVTPVSPNTTTGTAIAIVLTLFATFVLAAVLFHPAQPYVRAGVLVALAALTAYLAALVVAALRRDRRLRQEFDALTGKPLRLVVVNDPRIPLTPSHEPPRVAYHAPEPWAMTNIIVKLPPGRNPLRVGVSRFLAVTTVAEPSPIPMLLDDLASQLDLTEHERQKLRDRAFNHP